MHNDSRFRRLGAGHKQSVTPAHQRKTSQERLKRPSQKWTKLLLWNPQSKWKLRGKWTIYIMDLRHGFSHIFHRLLAVQSIGWRAESRIYLHIYLHFQLTPLYRWGKQPDQNCILGETAQSITINREKPLILGYQNKSPMFCLRTWKPSKRSWYR